MYMRYVGKIIAILPLLVSVSCRQSPQLFSDDDVLARVDRKSLRISEVQRMMPKGLSGADSVDYVDAYIDRWMVKQLKLQQAELMFSSSAADIDRMVEEYRQSLLIRKIEQYYLDTEMRSEVTDAEIEEYYNRHSSDFLLTKPVVKGCIVAISDGYSRREQLLRLMGSSRSEDRRDFEALCRKNNFPLTEFDEWVDFSEFLSYVPVLRSVKYDDMLSRRNIQQIHHNRTYYCFRITDVLRPGDRTPLFMVRDNIRRIIINQRQGEVIRDYERRLLDDAVENGHAKVMHEDVTEPVKGCADSIVNN